jgi:hypothetical protein
LKDTPQILSPGDATDIKEGKVILVLQDCFFLQDCFYNLMETGSQMPFNTQQAVVLSFTSFYLDSHLTERRGKTLAANMLTKQGALSVDRLQTC